ncbi:MAG: methyl-accepting chemotaxis protein [Deltaproteobacteria bacterium]|nr:methyl-accepting chemotaxis protein [Deltaproteobacteria bacterium]
MSGALATVALALSTVVAGVYTESVLIDAEREKITAVGSLVGSAVVVYVAMEEEEAAMRSLRELAPSVRGLVSIEVFLAEGGEFVRLDTGLEAAEDEMLHADAEIPGELGTVRTTVSTAAVTEAAGRAWRSLLVVLVVGVGLVLAVAGYLGDRMARMLRLMAQIARAVAKGDLSRTVPISGSRSEIVLLAEDLNRMVDNLRGLVGALSQTVAEVGSVAGESLATTERQQEGANEQTRAADRTLNATEALVESGERIHEASLEVVANADTSLENNKKSAAQSSDLERIVFKMGELLETVRDIAEKSEMLALNASLEGVRAQEHGAGFVLVATEMQRLSESILYAVLQMQQLAKEVRDFAGISSALSADGIRLADGTADSARLIGSLVGALQLGMGEVEQEMTQVSGSALSVASGSQQIAEAMRSLVELAGRLQDQIEVFRTEA